MCASEVRYNAGPVRIARRILMTELHDPGCDRNTNQRGGQGISARGVCRRCDFLWRRLDAAALRRAALNDGSVDKK